MISFRIVVAASAAVSVAYICGPLATPSSAAEPKQITETYDDWTVRCATLKGKKKRICEMVQAVRVRGKKGILAQIAIGKPPGSKSLKLIIQVPTRVLLQKGVVVSFDTTDKLDARFTLCTPSSCLAEFAFKNTTLSRIQKAKKATLSFVMANRKAIKVPISLRGFTDAASRITK